MASEDRAEVRLPGSLRESYSPHGGDWAFGSTSPSSAAASHPSAKSTVWSATATPSNMKAPDLSPFTPEDIPSDGIAMNTRELLRSLIGAALLQYCTTGIAMPFEVAKILMQSQWIPKDAIEGEDLSTPESAADENVEDDAASEASAESYFHDPAREAFQRSARLRSGAEGNHPLPTDGEGYVDPHAVENEEKAEYVLPIAETEGVWHMIKRIRELRSEGTTALWKGQLTSTVLETLTPIIQLSIQTILMSAIPRDPQTVYPLAASRIPTSHLIVSVAAHALTGFILSPLDLVRTRLIVQSSHPNYKMYDGPFKGLRRIAQEEGGVRAMYTHPNLLIPALLDNTIRPLLTLTSPLLLYRLIGISDDTHPMTYAVGQFICSSLSLLVTLPIETIRRRMQIQRRGGLPNMKACVELRPSGPYNGVIDTARKILSEERGAPRRRKQRSRSQSSSESRRPSQPYRRPSQGSAADFAEDLEEDNWFESSGISQLYRGFSMSLAANAIVFAIGAFAGIDASDTRTGWTEL